MRLANLRETKKPPLPTFRGLAVLSGDVLRAKFNNFFYEVCYPIGYCHACLLRTGTLSELVSYFGIVVNFVVRLRDTRQSVPGDGLGACYALQRRTASPLISISLLPRENANENVAGARRPTAFSCDINLV